MRTISKQKSINWRKLCIFKRAELIINEKQCLEKIMCKRKREVKDKTKIKKHLWVNVK